MGYWSAEILGGDVPLDIVLKIEKKLGTSLYKYNELNRKGLDEFKLKLKHTLNAFVDELLLEIDKDERGEALLVLAYICVKSHTKIQVDLQQRFILVAKNDAWANSPNQDDKTKYRRWIMDWLVGRIQGLQNI